MSAVQVFIALAVFVQRHVIRTCGYASVQAVALSFRGIAQIRSTVSCGPLRSGLSKYWSQCLCHSGIVFDALNVGSFSGLAGQLVQALRRGGVNHCRSYAWLIGIGHFSCCLAFVRWRLALGSSGGCEKARSGYQGRFHVGSFKLAI